MHSIFHQQQINFAAFQSNNEERYISVWMSSSISVYMSSSRKDKVYVKKNGASFEFIYISEEKRTGKRENIYIYNYQLASPINKMRCRFYVKKPKVSQTESRQRIFVEKGLNPLKRRRHPVKEFLTLNLQFQKADAVPDQISKFTFAIFTGCPYFKPSVHLILILFCYIFKFHVVQKYSFLTRKLRIVWSGENGCQSEKIHEREEERRRGEKKRQSERL